MNGFRIAGLFIKTLPFIGFVAIELVIHRQYYFKVTQFIKKCPCAYFFSSALLDHNLLSGKPFTDFF